MSRNFSLTPEARTDILSIWEYIAEEDSEESADRVVGRIYDECKKLGDMPGMGHWRQDLLNAHFRFWSIWSYLIVYRWEATPIEIVAVVHGARDLEVFLGGRRSSND